MQSIFSNEGDGTLAKTKRKRKQRVAVNIQLDKRTVGQIDRIIERSAIYATRSAVIRYLLNESLTPADRRQGR